jgi:hypothetical protein
VIDASAGQADLTRVLPQGRTADRQRNVPLAVLLVHEQQRGGLTERVRRYRWFERCPRTGRHLHLRCQPRQRLAETLAELLALRVEPIDHGPVTPAITSPSLL